MGEWNESSGGRRVWDLDSLRAALWHDDPRVRAQAARAIGYMGPEAAEAAPDLVRMVAADRGGEDALNALREIGEAAVPHIMNLLKSEETLSKSVAEALRAIARSANGRGER
ncbi:MAG: hypothetical protein JXA24_00565 [Proteobacteria bacterium]|nr:hypothetical protein [Pseudomonadota bacterium]